MSAPLLPLEQAAEEWFGGASPRALWALTKLGCIPHIRLGSLVRYNRDDIEAWLAAGRDARLAALKPLPVRKAKRGRRRAKANAGAS